MALQQFRNGAWHPITTLYAYRSGAWQRLKTLKTYRGGAWQLVGIFTPPLTLAANNVGVSGYNSVETGSSTATPSGGLGPYSYAWSKVSGDTMTVSSPTTAGTGFGSPTMAPGGYSSAVYQCTCTDSAGQVASTTISVAFAFLIPPH
jgi:predicted phage tail protein